MGFHNQLLKIVSEVITLFVFESILSILSSINVKLIASLFSNSTTSPSSRRWFQKIAKSFVDRKADVKLARNHFLSRLGLELNTIVEAILYSFSNITTYLISSKILLLYFSHNFPHLTICCWLMFSFLRTFFE